MAAAHQGTRQGTHQDAAQGAVEPHGDYVFAMTGKDCEQDTGITRAQQTTCRRLLIEQGLLSEDGQKGKVVRYRVHVDRLVQRLLQHAGPLALSLSQSGAAGDPAGPPAAQRSA